MLCHLLSLKIKRPPQNPHSPPAAAPYLLLVMAEPQSTFCNHPPTSPVPSSVTPFWLLTAVTNDCHVAKSCGHVSVLLCVTPSAPLDTADLSLLGAVGPQCPGWPPLSLATLSPLPLLASPPLPDSKIGKLQGSALSPLFSSVSIFSPYVTFTFFLITDDAQINPDLSSGQETDIQLLTCYLCLVVSSASPQEPAQKRNSNPSHPPTQHSSSPVRSQHHEWPHPPASHSHPFSPPTAVLLTLHQLPQGLADICPLY